MMISKNIRRGLSSCVQSLFPRNTVLAKEPFIIFETWFAEADKECDARVMHLATCSNKNFVSCKPMICTSRSRQGFKFFSNHKVDQNTIPEGSNVGVSFYWPSQRAVRLEGITFRLPKREVLEFFDQLTCEDQIQTMESNTSAPIGRKDVFREEINQEMEKSNGNLPDFLVGYSIMPKAIEFYQSGNDTFQERLRFLKTSMAPDNRITFAGHDGWAYEILSP